MGWDNEWPNVNITNNEWNEEEDDDNGTRTRVIHRIWEGGEE
jgi:hypothetical protein